MRRTLASLFAAAVCFAAAQPSLAAIQASADITSATGTAAPYKYSFNLHNTGTTNIATFWYAWDDSDLNFLPSFPQNITAPAGWIGFYTYGYVGDLSAYTYGIEWYNYAGTPLAAGNSLSGFSFETQDSPTVLNSISNVPPVTPGDPAFPVGTSFVYTTYPLTIGVTPSAQFVASVPEPASLGLLVVGGAGLWLRRNKRR